jgi:protein disulfide-isomerase A1
MIRQSLPTVSDVTTSNFEEILSLGTSVLIAYIDEGDQGYHSVFTSFAELHQNQFIFGIASDTKLAKSDVMRTPFIVLYNPLDEVTAVFKEEFEVDKIEHFIDSHSTPLIGKFSLQTYYTYTEVHLFY